MTGPEHYAAVERQIDLAKSLRRQGELEPADFALRLAQVHATAAQAAATALGRMVEGGPLHADRAAWIAAASEHPAQQRRIREAEAAEAREFAEEERQS